MPVATSLKIWTSVGRNWAYYLPSKAQCWNNMGWQDLDLCKAHNNRQKKETKINILNVPNFSQFVTLKGEGAKMIDWERERKKERERERRRRRRKQNEARVCSFHFQDIFGSRRLQRDSSTKEADPSGKVFRWKRRNKERKRRMGLY